VVLAGCHQRGRQSLRIVVDGEAEQHELHQRHAQHHREGDAVAPHLDVSLVSMAPSRRSEKNAFMPCCPARSP
jgi:hypothetical protein